MTIASALIHPLSILQRGSSTLALYPPGHRGRKQKGDRAMQLNALIRTLIVLPFFAPSFRRGVGLGLPGDIVSLWAELPYVWAYSHGFFRSCEQLVTQLSWLHKPASQSVRNLHFDSHMFHDGAMLGEVDPPNASSNRRKYGSFVASSPLARAT